MEEQLFQQMDMGKNIKELESRIKFLMETFQTATNTKVRWIHVNNSYSPQTGKDILQVSVSVEA